MDGTISRKKESDIYWQLFPLLLIVAMLVVALSTLSVIALIGMVPESQSGAAHRAAPKSDVERKPTKSPEKTSRPQLTGGAAGAFEYCPWADSGNKVAVILQNDGQRSVVAV